MATVDSQSVSNELPTSLGSETDVSNAAPPKKRGVPEGLWLKCPDCGSSVYKKLVEEMLNVCPKCEHHFYVSAQDRVKQVLDEGTWNERLRMLRRMGHLRIGVVWKWEHEDRFVMTVTVDPAGRELRGE